VLHREWIQGEIALALFSEYFFGDDGLVLVAAKIVALLRFSKALVEDSFVWGARLTEQACLSLLLGWLSKSTLGLLSLELPPREMALTQNLLANLLPDDCGEGSLG